MKKAIFAVAIAAAFNLAHATDAFSVGGGFGSSVTGSGGSMASSGTNGQGFSSQKSNSVGGGYAVGGTALGVAGNYSSIGGVSGSVGAGGSYTGSTSNGYTSGNGYGESKGGSGIDYGYSGYSSVTASYKF
jgi:hypothetical protein